MSTFNYTARDSSGKNVTGEIEAKSSKEVADQLHNQGMTVISINEKLGFDFKSLSEISFGGVPLKDRMIVVKQLSTMIGSGVPLIQALEVLVQQAENPQLKKEFRAVYKNVEGGMALSKAFKKSSKLFDDLQISLIEAGEKSGNLVEILSQIAVDMEKSTNLAGKIRGAMIYPAIIFVGIIGVMFFMVVFMIPAVQSLYDDLGLEDLPAITQAFVTLSDFLTNPIGLMVTIFTVIGFVIGFRAYNNSKSGKLVVDKLMLKIPVFGKLIEYSQIVQLTRLLAMLNRSGVSIIDSLNTVGNSLSNIHYRNALYSAAVDVGKGAALAPSLNKADLLPFILIRMIAVGEDTGALEQMLTDMSNFYDTELNLMADNLTKLMEPIILIVFGGMVGLLAVAIYLPIYSITQ